MEEKKIDDGGPAFGHGAANGHCCGMSLRDYFAGQALQGLLSHDGFVQWAIKDAGKIGMSQPQFASWRAYQFADAMLEARKK